jgi:signal transduction histidine kinase
VAHDFNNLLTVLSANLTLIEEATPDGSETRSLAAEARDAVRRGAKLTGQLLAVGRRQAMEPRAVDLFAHISGMRPLLARLLGEDVELALDLEREGTVVMADPAQMEQVVLNLIANARDALPRGGRVAITLVRSSGAVICHSERSLVAPRMRLASSSSGCTACSADCICW